MPIRALELHELDGSGRRIFAVDSRIDRGVAAATQPSLHGIRIGDLSFQLGPEFGCGSFNIWIQDSLLLGRTYPLHAMFASKIFTTAKRPSPAAFHAARALTPLEVEQQGLSTPSYIVSRQLFALSASMFRRIRISVAILLQEQCTHDRSIPLNRSRKPVQGSNPFKSIRWMAFGLVLVAWAGSMAWLTG